MKSKSKSCKKTIATIGIVLALVVIHLIVAIPFRVMSVIPGFTDIRPVLLLQPVYGVFFGIPGCISLCFRQSYCGYFERQSEVVVDRRICCQFYRTFCILFLLEKDLQNAVFAKNCQKYIKAYLGNCFYGCS